MSFHGTKSIFQMVQWYIGTMVHCNVSFGVAVSKPGV